MGICDNTKNGNSDEEIKPQAQNKEHPFLTFKSLLIAAKPVCKIVVPPDKLGSGFFISLFKK